MKRPYSIRVLSSLGASAALLALAFTSAHAAPVTGWGSLGFTTGTVTEGDPGSFVAAPSGNLSPRAVITPIDFSAIGASVTLSGTAQIANAPGNIQFRFGIYDTNGSANGENWLGYWASPRAFDGTGGSVLNGRTGGAGVFVSGTGSYNVTAETLSQTGTSGAGGTFDFVLTLTRVDAGTIGASYSFIQTAGGGTISIAGSYVDTGASTALTKFDAVGFLTNGSTGTITFSDISVIPEPSTYAAIFGVFVLGWVMVRRRRAS